MIPKKRLPLALWAAFGAERPQGPEPGGKCISRQGWGPLLAASPLTGNLDILARQNS